MDPEAELSLVRMALESTLSNCCEWKDDRIAMRVRNDSSLQGLTPEYIKQKVREFVRSGGAVEQRREQRPEYAGQRDHWYRVLFSEPGFSRGIFVEIVLVDEDEECPVVALVNAHPQME